jgi:hypothetical protein
MDIDQVREATHLAAEGVGAAERLRLEGGQMGDVFGPPGPRTAGSEVGRPGPIDRSSDALLRPVNSAEVERVA